MYVYICVCMYECMYGMYLYMYVCSGDLDGVRSHVSNHQVYVAVTTQSLGDMSYRENITTIVSYIHTYIHR